MTIKVLFSDMDFTLYRPLPGSNERGISAEDVAAIKKMQEEGNHFVVTTGRFSPSVFQNLEDYGIHCDMISSGGSAIYIQGELKVVEAIDIKLISQVFEDVIQMNCRTYFRFADEVNKQMLRFNNLDESLGIKEIEEYRKYFEDTKCIPNKISISFQTDDEMNEIKQMLIRKYGEYFFIEQSMPTNLDLTVSNVNKGSAIRYMLNHYGLKKEESAGIGDSYNDFAIFEDVSLTFAVENGVDQLKDAADYVVKDINEAYQIIKGGLGK